MSLFDELKRRKVFKVGAAYLVVAWLVVAGGIDRISRSFECAALGAAHFYPDRTAGISNRGGGDGVGV